MRICIVSPHLDDAILSCGLRIQRHVALSDEVFILNIFTAGTNGDNRQEEERQAAAVLGARPFFLDELDAPDRNPLYKSDIELFFGDFADVAPEFVAHVRARLEDFFRRHRIDIAYFPLAAGGHIDHRIAFAAGRGITALPVRYYEDRPYILWPGVLQGRMNDLGIDAGLPAVTERTMRDLLGSFHYLRHFVPEGTYQEACLPLYFKALQAPAARPVSARAEVLTASEEELARLYDSLRCYESQMGFIYPDYETFVKDSMLYEHTLSGREDYLERSWELLA